MPATLAGGDTPPRCSHRSATAPTTNITLAATMTPMGSTALSNISLNCGTCDATAMATRNPPNMAAPPSVGVARSCTLRVPGTEITPIRTATRRTTNVSRNVVSAATERTRAYPATANPLLALVQKRWLWCPVLHQRGGGVESWAGELGVRRVQ